METPRAKIGCRIRVALDISGPRGEAVLARDETLEPKEVRWGRRGGGGALVGPRDCGCIVGADEEVFEMERRSCRQHGRSGDNAGQLEVRVGDSAPRIVEGDKLALDGRREWAAPGEGPQLSRRLWPGVGGVSGQPNPTHSLFGGI